MQNKAFLFGVTGMITQQQSTITRVIFELVLNQFRAKTDEVLQTHVEMAPRNALYTSKTIQNQMISVVGSVIKNKLIKQ